MSASPNLVHDVVALPATELVALLRTGQLSAREAVKAYISRIEEVNPKINAVVVPLFDEALEQADRLDSARLNGEELGPMHGLPVSIKESIEIAGTPSTLGLTERATTRAIEDGYQVQQLKRAGAVVLCKTNVALLLKAYETDNPVYGRTNNPWNLDRAPGGSSGGEGALVAAGGSALGLGSDLCGSIRLPAHACGINALRPTAGRLTMSGHTRMSKCEGLLLSQPGPIARHVTDLALAMRVLTDSHQIEPLPDSTVPPISFLDSSSISVKGLRLGFYCENGILSPSPAIKRAVLEAAASLDAAGAIVEEWCPPDLVHAWEVQLRLMCADGLMGYKRALKNSRGSARFAVLPASVRKLFALVAQCVGEKRLAASIRFKQGATLQQYFELLGERKTYLAKFMEAFNRRKLHAVICPPDALPAVRHGSSSSVSGCSTSYPGLFTLLGMPAGVVAVTRVRNNEESTRLMKGDMFDRGARDIERDSTGLPVGVQVAAPHWREEIVLAVMSAVEKASRQSSEYPSLDQLPSFSDTRN